MKAGSAPVRAGGATSTVRNTFVPVGEVVTHLAKVVAASAFGLLGFTPSDSAPVGVTGS